MVCVVHSHPFAENTTIKEQFSSDDLGVYLDHCTNGYMVDPKGNLFEYIHDHNKHHYHSEPKELHQYTRWINEKEGIKPRTTPELLSKFNGLIRGE